VLVGAAGIGARARRCEDGEGGGLRERSIMVPECSAGSRRGPSLSGAAVSEQFGPRRRSLLRIIGAPNQHKARALTSFIQPRDNRQDHHNNTSPRCLGRKTVHAVYCLLQVSIILIGQEDVSTFLKFNFVQLLFNF